MTSTIITRNIPITFLVKRMAEQPLVFLKSIR